METILSSNLESKQINEGKS